MLDFMSVGRTGSRRVPGHSVVCRDYPSRGRNGYTSATPHDRVPRLVTRLVVDYFDYATCLGASTRRAAHHATRRAAHRRLLRLHRASGCLGTSRGSSRRSSSTTSPTPRVQVPRHGAARHAARRAARRRLLRPVQARR
jgi:hypothetical protein